MNFIIIFYIFKKTNIDHEVLWQLNDVSRPIWLFRLIYSLLQYDIYIWYISVIIINSIKVFVSYYVLLYYIYLEVIIVFIWKLLVRLLLNFDKILCT